MCIATKIQIWSLNAHPFQNKCALQLKYEYTYVHSKDTLKTPLSNELVGAERYFWFLTNTKMATLPLFSLSHSVPVVGLRPRFPSPQTHVSNSICSPYTASTTLKLNGFRDKTVVFGSKSSDPNESQFLDENGVVDDMDGYLNYLSLEYDSVWDTKPSW